MARAGLNSLRRGFALRGAACCVRGLSIAALGLWVVTARTAGRYAPSPTGDLHFGNLRTALLAWILATQSGRDFLIRVEDIDTGRVRADSAARQLADLAALGMAWSGSPVYQHDRDSAYEAALAQLPTYECFCSRKDILAASSAPHVAPGHYPGTCRRLTENERAAKRAEFASQGRVPAIRLAAEVDEWPVTDVIAGPQVLDVDDFILRRGAMVGQGQNPDWAYNLAVVVDDGASNVDQVVRGDDLLSSSGRQAYLAHLLGLPTPEFVHVPLVVNEAGVRLSKRDGAVTLRDLAGEELAPDRVKQVFTQLAHSIGVPHATNAEEAAEQFRLANLPPTPYVFECRTN